MALFARSTWPHAPKSQESKQVAVVYAIIIVCMLLAQLFTFEEFLLRIEEWGFLNNLLQPYVIAVLIVCIEFFALPFLLRMKLSPAMRHVSMVCSWLVPLVWLGISIWLIIDGSTFIELAVFGSVGALPPGAWSIAFFLGLAMLSAWASWGLWPGREAQSAHDTQPEDKKVHVKAVKRATAKKLAHKK